MPRSRDVLVLFTTEICELYAYHINRQAARRVWQVIHPIDDGEAV
jgi:hypothetical protein